MTANPHPLDAAAREIVCLGCDRRVEAIPRPDIDGLQCPRCGYINLLHTET